MADRTLRIKLLANTDSYKAEMQRASRLSSDYFKTTGNSSQRLTAYINQNTNAFSGLNKNIQTATNTLKTFAGAFIGGFAVSSIINVADNYGQMAQRIKNSLKSVDGDISNYEMVQNRLVETSIRNAKDLADSQELYIRSAESMKTLGYSTEQTLDFVESLSSAFTSNATASDKVKSSIDALNKAFVSGKVSAQQWETLSAAMPNLAGQIATALGKERAEIVKLGNAGKLSITQLANGTIKSKDAFNALADSMDNTIKDGFSQLSTAFQHYIGEANQTYKVTATVASGMTYLAKNFDLVVDSGMVLISLSLARYFGNLSNSIIASTAASVKKAIELRNQALAQKEALTATLANIQAEKQFAVTNQASLATQLKLAQTEQSRTAIRAQMKANTAQIIALDKAESASKLSLAAATKQASIASTTLNKAQGLLKSGLGLLGGPSGLLFLVAGGIASLAFSADSATPNMRDYAKSIDEIKKSLEGLNKTQLEGKSADLRDEEKAQKEIIKGLEQEIRLRQSMLDIINDPSQWGNDGERLRTALQFGDEAEITDFLAQKKRDLYEETQKLNNIHDEQTLVNEKLTASTNNLATATNNLEGSFDKVTTTSISEKIKEVSAQLELAELSQQGLNKQSYIYQNVLSSLGGEAEKYKTALLGLITGTADMTDLTDEEVNALQPLIDKLGKLYDKTKSGNKSYIEEVKNLKKQLSLLKDSYYQSSAEAQILSLEQSTGTKVIGKQREELTKLFNLMDGYKNLSSLSNPLVAENNSYNNSKSALDDWLSKNKDKQKEYYGQLEKLEADHQIKVAQIKSNQAVSDIDNAVALVDPVKALENENAKKLALIQEFETQRFLTEQQALALREAENYQFEQNRIAAQWEIWRNQSEANDFLASSLEGLAGSAASTISGLMSGTMNATEAMQNFANVILNQAIGSLVQMGLQQVQNAITAQTISATTTAAQMAEAAALAAAYTPAAIQASIATMGSAATIGAASYATSMGTMKAASLVGMAHDGIDSIPQEGTWLLQKGERVLSQSQNKDFSSLINDRITNSPSVIINNYGNDGVDVEQRDNQTIINIAAKKGAEMGYQKVRESISSHTGGVWTALTQNTNAKAKL